MLSKLPYGFVRKTFLSRLTGVAFCLIFLFVGAAEALSLPPGSSAAIVSAQATASSASLQLRAIVGQSLSGINSSALRQHAGRLFAVKQLELTSPNGGEVWSQGLTYRLTWRKTPAVGAVRLAISTNAGLSFSQLTTSSVSGGEYDWQVDAPATSSALLRVSSATLPSMHMQVTDTSDELFEISTNAGLVVRPRIWLEGPLSGGSMRTDLLDLNFLPISQPFTVAPFNYSGGEQRSNSLDSIVDWVLLELRSAADFRVVQARCAAVLLADGRVVDPAGADAVLIADQDLAAGEYYVVVFHRNHLGVISSSRVSLGGGSQGVYDFRTARAQALRRFSVPQANLGTPGFGLFAGDAQPNGFINAADRVAARRRVFDVGYLTADVNMDGVINAGDRVLARNNAFKISNVP